MPRRLRLIFPGLPHHVIHRGHSRNAVFFSDSDRVDYLGTLAECRALFALRVYAYCLMTNHVHLIVDPGDDPRHISLLMQRLAGRHSRRTNAARGTSGSLWEGRFKCSVIDTDRYLLACGRYIDQNPVRARMVSRPSDYRWSSYPARAGMLASPFLDPDPAIEALSADEHRRRLIYRKLADTPVDDADLELIRTAAQRNQLTGDAAFVEKIRALHGVDVPPRAPGRYPAPASR